MRLRGLMTGSPGPQRKKARPLLCQELFQKVGKSWPLRRLAPFVDGMTNDFEVAVEEGATIVRIGTAIFQASEEG